LQIPELNNFAEKQKHDAQVLPQIRK